MSQVTRLDLPLLLPDAPDTRDACIIRLVTVLEGQPGVAQAHVLDVGDLDGDGYVDIVVANSDDMNRIFLNRPSQ